MTPLTAFCVCVDYSDILAITLPYNIRHFKDVVLITSPADKENVLRVASLLDRGSVSVFETDLFYRNGAKFNKWAALEAGLDMYGRKDWICLLDADVLWPKDAWRHLTKIQPGFFYTPRRRMFPDLPTAIDEVPIEEDWKRFPLHRNEGEFAGYSQIFHADDTRLGPPPWHQIDWLHAGGADSFFQMKWPPHLKIRPMFEVLHLGPAGVNWMGRTMPYMDGTIPEGGPGRKLEMAKMFWERRKRSGDNRFEQEKIKR